MQNDDLTNENDLTNDLSGYKMSGVQHLEDHDEKEKKKVGRKPKPEAEKETKTIALKVTESEYEAAVNNAPPGVPVSTYLKLYLRTESNIFTKK